jgi:hypothetical protein
VVHAASLEHCTSLFCTLHIASNQRHQSESFNSWHFSTTPSTYESALDRHSSFVPKPQMCKLGSQVLHTACTFEAAPVCKIVCKRLHTATHHGTQIQPSFSINFRSRMSAALA